MSIKPPFSRQPPTRATVPGFMADFLSQNCVYKSTSLFCAF
jgi:hypothetical protein